MAFAANELDELDRQFNVQPGEPSARTSEPASSFDEMDALDRQFGLAKDKPGGMWDKAYGLLQTIGEAIQYPLTTDSVSGADKTGAVTSFGNTGQETTNKPTTSPDELDALDAHFGLDQEKVGVNAGQETIIQSAPEPTTWDKIKEAALGPSDKEIAARRDRSALAVGMAEQAESDRSKQPVNQPRPPSPSEILANFDAESKQLGGHQLPSTGELLSGVMLGPIAAGLMSNPAGTVLGLAAWEALSEAESAGVSALKGEEHKFGDRKGLKDLLPEEAGGTAQDVAEVADFLAKGKLLHAGLGRMDSVWKNIKDSQWFRELTVKERGLVAQSLSQQMEGLQGAAKTEGEKIASTLRFLKQNFGVDSPEYQNYWNEVAIKSGRVGQPGQPGETGRAEQAGQGAAGTVDPARSEPVPGGQVSPVGPDIPVTALPSSQTSAPQGQPFMQPPAPSGPEPVENAAVAEGAMSPAGQKAGKPHELGSIVAGHESGGRAGAIGHNAGDIGGASYGTFQLAANTGTLQRFLGVSGYDKAFAGLTPGSAGFDAKWKELAGSDPDFAKAQRDFIVSSHYEPVRKYMVETYGVDPDANAGLAEAVFAAANGHGEAGAKRVLDRVFSAGSGEEAPQALANRIYDERLKRDESGALAYYRSSSPAIQKSVAGRLAQERDQVAALARGEEPVAMTARVTIPAGTNLAEADGRGRYNRRTVADDIGDVSIETDDGRIEAVDALLGPKPESGPVFLARQVDAQGQPAGEVALLGYGSGEEARAAIERTPVTGLALGGMVETDRRGLSDWLAAGKLDTPATPEVTWKQEQAHGQSRPQQQPGDPAQASSLERDTGQASPDQLGRPGSGGPGLGQPGARPAARALGHAVEIEHAEGRDSGRYELRDARGLIPSHDVGRNFLRTPDYPADVQERPYHSDQGEQLKVRGNAANLNPAFLLTDNPDVINGPPVITRDGVVLGGNSRAMSIQQAYAEHPERGQAYKTALAAKARSFGLRPEDVEAIERPVLVRALNETPDAAGMARKARLYNQTLMQGLDATAEGVSRARMLSPDTLSLASAQMDRYGSLREYMAAPDSRALISALTRDGVLEQRQLHRLTNRETGLLNEDGKRLVERVLRGRAVDDFDVLDAAPPAVLEKIDRILPYVAQVQAVGGRWDISAPLKGAVRQATRFRASGAETVETYFGQGSLLPDPEKADPSVQRLTFALVKMKPTDFALAWRRYAALAKAAAADQVALPGAEPKSQPEAFGAAFSRQRQAQPADLFASQAKPQTPDKQIVTLSSGHQKEASRVEDEWVISNGSVYSVVRPEVLAGQDTGQYVVVLGGDGATPAEAVRKYRDWQTSSEEVRTSRNSPENTFNREPEAALAAMNDAEFNNLLRAFGLKPRSGQSRIGIIERLMGSHGLVDIRKQYLALVDPSEPPSYALRDKPAGATDNHGPDSGRDIARSRTDAGSGGVSENARQALLPSGGRSFSVAEGDRPDAGRSLLYHKTLPSDRVLRLQRQVERFENVTFTSPLHETPAFDAPTKTAQAIAKFFGREAVFFVEPEDSPFPLNGAVIGQDLIYLNAKSSKPHLHVLGHELVHAMRRDAPEIYHRFAEVTRGLLQNMPEYRQRLAALGAPVDDGRAHLDVQEELLGDFMGENMVRPEFWQELAEKDPDIFTRLAQAVKRFLDWLFDKAVPDMTTAKFFADLERARTAAVEALAKYARFRGGPDSSTPGAPKYARREGPAPGFYSRMEDVLDAKLPGKGLGGQFKTVVERLAAKGDFKREELQWSGLVPWLEERKGRQVRKAEVLNFLEANRIEVREVVKGEPEQLDPQDLAPGYRITRLAGNGQFLARNPGGTEQSFETRAQAYDWLNEGFRRATKSDTKFHQHQLSGGEYYREMLLTLPNEEKYLYKTLPSDAKIIKQAHNLYWVQVPSISNQYIGHGNTAAEAKVEALRTINEIMAETKNTQSYRSSHWDEPNVLAHIRFSERTDSENRRVLHIEEVQSDWHQEGRRKGYAGQFPQTVFDAAVKGGMSPEQATADIRHLMQEPLDHPNRPTMEQWDRLVKATSGSGIDLNDVFHGKPEQVVPDAPFKNSWPLLSMKRMIRWAAENGYNRVAWTPGDVQAKRYDLSKQVSEVTLTKSSTLVANDLKGREILRKQNITLEQAADYIGKEVANKLFDADPDQYGDRVLRGLDLRVGGEGMKGFYDKILPSEVNKYIKQWGAKVTDMDLPLRSPLAESPSATLHAFDVTPAMRKAVLLEGQPFFALDKAATAPEDAGDAVARVRAEVARLQAGAKGALPVDVHADQAHLPRALRPSQGRVLAVYDPDARRVHLVARNLVGDNVPAAVARAVVETYWQHEQAGHWGLEALFRDMHGEAWERPFNQFLDNVARSAPPAQMRRLAGLYGYNLADRAERRATAEEFFAHVAQEVRDGMKLDGQKRAVWRRFLDLVRAWLQKLGLMRLRPEDIEEAALAALRRVRRGEDTQRPAFEPSLRPEPAFARKDRPLTLKKGVSARYTPDHAVRGSKDWHDAKEGDLDAARRIVDRVWSDENTEALRRMVGGFENPALVSVPSSSGRNAVPVALGERLADDLGIPFMKGEDHWQALHDTEAKRIDAKDRAFSPRLFRPEDSRKLARDFDGRDVILVEDTLTTGQTAFLFAQALHAAGVRVRTVAALFGNPDVSPGERQVERLRQALRERQIPFQAAELAKGLSRGEIDIILTRIREVKPDERQELARDLQRLQNLRSARSLRKYSLWEGAQHAPGESAGHADAAQAVQAGSDLPGRNLPPESRRPVGRSPRFALDPDESPADAGRGPAKRKAESAADPAGLELPELVHLARQLMGSTPKILARMGNKRGQFSPKGIILSAEIFKGEKLESILTPDPTRAEPHFIQELAEKHGLPVEMILTEKRKGPRGMTEITAFKVDEMGAPRTLAHEIGHLIDFLPDAEMRRGNMLGHLASLKRYMKGWLDGVSDKAVRAEVKALSKWWRPWNEGEDAAFDKYRKSAVELYADALSVLLNSPDALKSRAPAFYDAFFDWLDRKPEVRDVYNRIQDDLKSGQAQKDRVERLRAGFRRADEAYRDFYDRPHRTSPTLRKLFVDEFSPLYSILTEKRPRYLVERAIYSGSEKEAYIKDFYHEVLRPLEDAGLTNADLDEWAFHERVAGERRHMANPQGWTAKASRERLNEMKASLGPERWEALTRAGEGFRELRRESITAKMEASGMFSEDLMKAVRKADSYATFDVVDYIADRLGSGMMGAKIFRQIGTLKDVTGPVTATIMKDLAMIASINWNTAKRAVVRDLLRHRPGEIEAADRRWNGRAHVPVEPASPDRGLLVYMEDGKPSGWYVDVFAAEAFSKEQSEALKYLGGMLGALATPYRMVFTQLRPGFQAFNVIRDFRRTVMNLPGANPELAFIRHYVKALRPAWRSVFGVPDATVREMERGNMLISVADPGGLSREDEQLERLLMQWRVKPKEFRLKALKPFEKLFAGALELGGFLERIPKVASYTYLRERFPDLDADEVGHIVRGHAGSPGFLYKGELHPVINNVFLFSNACKEGWRSDYEAMRSNPKAWWWKWAKWSLLPKLAMFGAAAGMLGAGTKMVMDGASEYDKTNYLVIPLGLTAEGKSVYLRMPQEEFARVSGGVMWKLLHPEKRNTWPQLFDYLSGQAPTVNPAFEVTGQTITYLSGRNPYDSFRGKNVIEDTSFTAGGWESHKQMLRWIWNASGGGIVHTFRGGDVEPVRGELETILNMPVASDTLGRFLKVTDQGVREELRNSRDAVREQAAQETLAARKALAKLINGEPLEAEDATAILNKMDYAKKKLLPLIIRRGGETLATELMAAKTDEEKAAVLRKWNEIEGVKRFNQ